MKRYKPAQSTAERAAAKAAQYSPIKRYGTTMELLYNEQTKKQNNNCNTAHVIQ